MSKGFKLLAGVFSAAIAVLGLAGAWMGLGYILRNLMGAKDGVEYDTATRRQNNMTGSASIAAGIAVAGASIPIYGLFVRFGDLLTEIYTSVTGH